MVESGQSLAVIGGDCPDLRAAGLANGSRSPRPFRALRPKAIVSTMGVLANVSEDLAEEASVVAPAVAVWFPSAMAAFSCSSACWTLHAWRDCDDGAAAAVKEVVLVRHHLQICSPMSSA
ncbi:MAG: hypothetical protein ACLVJX_08725 [Merdibacter sp.]